MSSWIKGKNDSTIRKLVSEGVQSISRASESAGGALSYLSLLGDAANIFAKNSIKPNKLLIFDDLERSTLWNKDPKALIGTINHYVEHQGFCVIVICNDQEIKEKLKSIKEKTFGHTIKITPNTDSAINLFINEIKDNSTRSFIQSISDSISTIWKQSGRNSLRILRHTIKDAERLYKSIENSYKQHDKAMNHVFYILLALSIEERSEEIEFFPDGTLDLQKIQQKYPNYEISFRMISKDIVNTLFIDRSYCSDIINNWIGSLHYFLTNESTPQKPWEVIINLDQNEENSLEENIILMNDEFENRTIKLTGDFMHVFAIRLFLAESNYPGYESIASETEKCKIYIDDLYNRKELPPPPHEFRERFTQRSHHGNYSYHTTRETDEKFSEIVEHLERKQQEVINDKIHEQGKALEYKIKDRDSEFIGQEMIDIFSSIKIHEIYTPQYFSEILILAPTEKWFDITSSLAHIFINYKNNQTEEDKRWISKVCELITDKWNEADGISKLRLRWLLSKISPIPSRMAT